MALYTYHHDAPTITAAGREWVQRCLVRDGSILGEGAISTAANYDVLDRHFLQRLDVGSGNFFEKLRTQLEDAPPPARKLMAELLWALFLFLDRPAFCRHPQAIIHGYSRGVHEQQAIHG